MFKIEFSTSGSAFEEYESYESYGEGWASSIEVKRILNRIVTMFYEGHSSGSIIDSNGNKVGEWSYDVPIFDEEDEE